MTVASLFERLSKNRPTRITKEPEPSPAQQLLNFIQRWPRDTLSTRDILLRGPYVLRKRKYALEAAERLVRNGWLVPVASRQYNAYTWQVIRRQVIDPAVTADSPLKLHEPPL